MRTRSRRARPSKYRSLWCKWLQPLIHMLAASGTYGCSLWYLRLQAHRRGVTAERMVTLLDLTLP
eukprot:scaffold85182_cov38-Phaeocystis_antarctica.AAC.1